MDTMDGGWASAGMRWVRRHRPLVDALGVATLSVVTAAFGLGEIWDALSVLPEPVSPWWGVVVAAPAVAAVAAKRRFPRTGLVVTAFCCAVAIFTVGGVGTLVALLDLLWTVTLTASPAARRRILAGCVAATIAMTGLALVVTADLRIAVLVGLQLGALLGTDYWWATAVAQANELAELHRREARDIAAQAERERDEALQRERDAMSRELHDLVAGHVSAVAIRAESALSSRANAEADRAALRAVRDSSLEAHHALRSMISVLRAGGGELVVPPGLERVPEYVAAAERAGLDVRLDGDDTGDVPVVVEQVAARVVQEGLANCVRHAAGGRVSVSIETTHEGLRVRVDSRDGRALERPALSGNGTGLGMLGERVRALGGRFEAGPVGAGWSVRATIPLGAAA